MIRWSIDATKFQNQLGELTATIALKVHREGPRTIKNSPASLDIYVLVRQAQRTCDLFFYLNADEHRKGPYWRAIYTIVALPLIRSMIDCLYNITAMLDDPQNRPAEFRKSGYRMALEALEEDRLKYGSNPDTSWSDWLDKRARDLDFTMRSDGFTPSEVMSQSRWPTLGAYLREKKDASSTPHQLFLRNLTYGYWREYSEYSHGTFQGLLRIAMFYLERDMPHEDRPKIEEISMSVIFSHMTRACAILLCILTELQAFFHFEGARINARLHEIWNALLPAPEVKDLYDSRYGHLMKDQGIIGEPADQSER
jgi:hypothetical protein